MAKVSIHVAGQTKEMEVAEGANLLLEAASRSIPIPFKCTTGRCGTCRVRVIEGSSQCSDYTEPELHHLNETDLASVRRLACQTFIHGDVAIEIP
ncbi:2Fe-2S iron-sulfur cluster-binding protein [Laceyella tengchongensis]|uniref:2Fe-2S iron-sulfur cluster-binding protein n=1 Tax=Laceyella tengchongensis TaxID=574699 RepID=UPI0012B8376E|nr:2Fe-2S iron-sulfur cluster binding domain-containing protein [Laceyella tengchongensis]